MSARPLPGARSDGSAAGPHPQEEEGELRVPARREGTGEPSRGAMVARREVPEISPRTAAPSASRSALRASRPHAPESAARTASLLLATEGPATDSSLTPRPMSSGTASTWPASSPQTPTQRPLARAAWTVAAMRRSVAGWYASASLATSALPRSAAVVGSVGASFVLGEGIHPGPLAK